MSDIVVTLLVAVVILVGTIGTVVPFVPGLTLVWLGVAGYGLAVGFARIGWLVLIVATVGLVGSVIKSVLLPKHLAENQGVSRASMAVAAGGAIVGFFTIPIIGLAVGAMFGLLVAEYVVQRDLGVAWTRALMVVKSVGLGALVDLGLAMGCLALWSIWAGVVLL